MTVTTMPRQRANRVNRSVGWVAASAFAVCIPKCIFCLTIYTAVGAKLGTKFLGAEYCSASGNPWESWFPLVALSAIGVIMTARRLHARRLR